jgi:hypothetical protein
MGCFLIAVSCGTAAREPVVDYMVQDSVGLDRPSGMVPPTTTTAPLPKEGPPSASTAGQSFDTDTQRMIVRTANMQLVVNDISVTLERITKLAEDFDGYVVSSNKWKEGGRLLGTIAIRVPAEKFDSAVKTLREMADEVTYENTSAKDVTEEYVDLSAKLKNLEATEEQLLQIMKKAEKVDDILAVQRELTSTRSEIERTKGRLQYLEQTSETSLIEVRLTQSKLDVKLTAISGRNVRGGEKVYFKAEISGGFAPYTYKWDFGDKAISTDEVPVHAYNSPGNFTVSLTVIDDKGNTATDTRADYITVQSGWNAGSIAKSAWKGLGIFGQVVADILIWLGIFSPVWIIGGGVWFWVRRRSKRKKAAKAG